MNIDFSAPLLDLNGRPIRYSDAGEQRDMQLRDACVDALMSTSGSLADGKAKFAVFELAERINKGGVSEVSPEEATLLKEKIGVAWTANVVGPAYRLLNG
jgi:hypothetical protein